MKFCLGPHKGLSRSYGQGLTVTMILINNMLNERKKKILKLLVYQCLVPATFTHELCLLMG